MAPRTRLEYKSLIGWTRFDDTNVNKVPPVYLPLVFWIRPVNGSPYKVDLTGMLERAVDGRRRPAATVRGHDSFTYAFAEFLCRDRTPHPSYLGKRQALRTFFRFLAEDDPTGGQQYPDFLADDMCLRLQSWLERRGSSEYSQIRSVVDQIRAVALPVAGDIVPLLWPPSHSSQAGPQKDIEFKSIQKLNMDLVKEAMSIKAMFKEGDSFGEAGLDASALPEEASEAAWRSPENHAWLAKRILAQEWPGVPEGPAFCGPPLEPSYLAPGMAPAEDHALDRKLRWFTFGRRDAIVFLWIFLLKTGWNLSTALNLDVRDEHRWCHVDRLSPEHRTLRARKPRAGGRLQYATSLERPQWFPYQIVRFMVERTKPLREILKKRLAEATARATTDTSTELERHIAQLKAAVRSPWLYVTTDGGVGAARLGPHDGTTINEVARLVSDRRKRNETEVPGGAPAPNPVAKPEAGAETAVKWVTRDARKARIRHAYEASGFDAIVAQAAGGHASVRTGKHYLGAASLDEAGEKRFRAMQAAIFSDLGDGRPLDPTRLKILVDSRAITPEQEARLRDLRMRTKVGMGCLDHTNPPRSIAPAHTAGKPCAVQRCACCQNGVLFEDSLNDLAKRAVELRLIQETSVPFGAWVGSSFEAEVEAIEAMLKAFDLDDVEAAMSNWQTRFERGDAVVQDTFPDYTDG